MTIESGGPASGRGTFFDSDGRRGQGARVLVENLYVKQERDLGGARRRWFESDGLELVVWLGAAGGVEGFQLCYERREGERALTWRAGRGFEHNAIDDGGDDPMKNKTPVLIPVGAVPWAELTELFRLKSERLEPELRALVLARLAARA